MKILFCSFRYDPQNIDSGSGFDYDFFQAFSRHDAEIKVIGPPHYQAFAVERLFARLYKKATGNSYAKFRLSMAYRLSSELNRNVKFWNPDVVFTIWPNFLVFYNQRIPTVYSVDTCLYGEHLQWPSYGKLAMKITEWEEKRAFHKCAAIITHSHWTKNIISSHYNIKPDIITVLPVSASIPTSAIPKKIDIRKMKEISKPIKLLLVGRVFHRKGIDIAIETVRILNSIGFKAFLSICGMDENEKFPFVEFVGLFKKSNQEQLNKYMQLYRDAHLLIHPARFEAAGIVPSEAAAFGTPTITNDAGGLGTTVADGTSGIVLPKDSPAEAYARAIMDLINDPERYYRLCETTRQRYEQELNWDVTSKRVVELVRRVVAEHKDKQ